MSLHRILVLTVTLLHCLTAHPISRNQQFHIVNDIEASIEILKNGVCNEPDSTFYSPDGTNGCMINALQCSILELETLKTECFDSNPKDFQLLSRTRDNIKLLLEAQNTVQADFKDCFCEKEKPNERPHKEFLDNLWKLVQMLNSS